jgi:hypothetical protein
MEHFYQVKQACTKGRRGKKQMDIDVDRTQQKAAGVQTTPTLIQASDQITVHLINIGNL